MAIPSFKVDYSLFTVDNFYNFGLFQSFCHIFRLYIIPQAVALLFLCPLLETFQEN